jgi:hypothetical protein
MDDAAGSMFQVRPGDLTNGSEVIGTCSDELCRIHGDMSVVPPSAVFGLLPESVALAAALDRCVRRSTGDLGDAVDVSASLGSGLAMCAQNYAEVDSTHASRIGRVAT